MSQGWIKLHRKFSEHWLWEEKRVYSKAEAWIDLLWRANHKDAKVILGNELINVKRGQFITSELKLMKQWSWSKTKVRDFLKLLQVEQMIEKNSDSKKTAITIVNYEVYQDSETAKKPQKNRKKTAKELQKNTNKNDKNDKNEKEIVFDFWNEQKITKHQSLSEKITKEIDKALKKHTVDEILTSITHYSKMLKDDNYSICSYAWGLDTFLKREGGFEKFMDSGEKWVNYLSWKKKQGKPAAPRIKPETDMFGNEVGLFDAGRGRS